MAATDARPVPRKNTAWRVYFSIRKSDGTLVTSWTGADSEESLDGGSFTDCTNEATEIGTSGCGYLDLTAAEMNADAVMIKITVTNSGALPLVMTVFPEEAGDYRADVTHFGGTAGTFSGGRPEVNTTHWGGTAVGSVTINCNMTQISGDTVAADNAEAFFDGTGYAGTNNVIPTVGSVSGSVGSVAGSVGGNVTGSVGSVVGNVGGNVVGSVGSVTGNVSGSVGSVAANGISAASLATDAGTELATAIWSALTTATWATDSFGAKVLIGENTNRTVKVTGSNHAAADVHEFQPNVIDADAIAASAVTEIQSGLATAAALTTVEGKIDTVDNFIDTEVLAIKAVTDKIDTGLVLDGAVYQFTANMLELAPAGGGGGGTDWTANERTAIRTILGIPGSGTTPADPTDGVLFDIKAKTDQIGSANAITSLLAGAVLDPGTITSFPETLVIGDSYQETDGREIQIPLVDTDGNVLTTVGSRNLADATATFEIRRINESDPTRVITGTATIVDPPGTGTGAGAPYAVVELPADETDKGLVGYRYKGKLTLTWQGPGTDVYSFDTATIKFTY